MSVCVHQKSLHFPEDAEVSNKLRDLIGRLLTEPGGRIEYKELKEHRFFSPTNWNDLLDSKSTGTVAVGPLRQ